MERIALISQPTNDKSLILKPGNDYIFINGKEVSVIGAVTKSHVHGDASITTVFKQPGQNFVFINQKAVLMINDTADKGCQITYVNQEEKLAQQNYIWIL